MADQRIVCPHCQRFSLVIPPQYSCEYCRKPLQQAPPEHSGPAPILSHSEEIEKPNPEQRNFGDGNWQFSSQNTGRDSGFVMEVTRIENQVAEKAGKDALAWLIVHTEGRTPVYYEVFEGQNVFGRWGDGYEVDIEIQEDTYVSRSHAHVLVEQDFLGRFRFSLWDDGAHRIGGRTSTNGTYVNGNKERLPGGKAVFLEDGDTIQVGETKLVFKLVNEEQNDVQVVATEVISGEYTKTVVFG